MAQVALSGTAANAIDYTVDTAPANVNLAGNIVSVDFALGGPLSQAFQLAVADDTVLELAETLTATLSAVLGGANGQGLGCAAIATISGDEVATYAIAAHTAAGLEDGPTVAGDFNVLTGSPLTFTPGGSNTQTITVADAVVENDETLTVTLDSVAGSGAGAATAGGTIHNDDATTFAIAVDAPSIGEEAGPAALTYTITRTGVAPKPAISLGRTCYLMADCIIRHFESLRDVDSLRWCSRTPR
jgi:hypothetical protein